MQATSALTVVKQAKIINFIAILFYFPFQQQREKNGKAFMLRAFFAQTFLLLL